MLSLAAFLMLRPSSQGAADPVPAAAASLLTYRNALSSRRHGAWERLPQEIKATVYPNVVTFSAEGTLGFAAVSRQDDSVLGYYPFPLPLPFSDKPMVETPPYSPVEAEAAAREAFRLSGMPYRLGPPHADSQDGGQNIDYRFPLYDGELRIANYAFLVDVVAALGTVRSTNVEGPWNKVEDIRLLHRPENIRFVATPDLVRSVAAAAAFAEAKARLQGSGSVLDSTAEPEKGLWLAARPVLGGRNGAEQAPGPTEDQLAAAARGEGTPVWIVSLKGDALPFKGETASFPLVKAYVDAQTGRLLWFDYMDQYGFGGGSPTAEPRPAPVLSGPAALTVAGKLRQVRLTPVAATRPFVPSGRAVLGIGKRLFDAEYDAKAGLVRYKGKLARTLLTLP